MATKHLVRCKVLREIALCKEVMLTCVSHVPLIKKMVNDTYESHLIIYILLYLALEGIDF